MTSGYAGLEALGPLTAARPSGQPRATAPTCDTERKAVAAPDVGVQRAGSMDGEAYERWVASVDLDTGRKKGHVRDDANHCGLSRS